MQRRIVLRLAQCVTVAVLAAGMTHVAYDSARVDVTDLTANDEAEISNPQLTAGSLAAVNNMITKQSTNLTSFGTIVDIVGLSLDDGTEPIITDVSYTRFVTNVLNIRNDPNIDGEVIGKFMVGDEVTVTGEIEDTDYVRITYNGEDAYVHSAYLSEDQPKEVAPVVYTWDGAILNKLDGTVSGPSGKETYYNLDMTHVVEIMHSMGYEGEYWVRSDGCKMFGDYIMVAADLTIRPKGTILETSLGTAIVCDTGDFAASNPYQLDIAVTW